MGIRSSKKGIEFSFTWLFAVIVGAFILFLAIYAATKIIQGGGAEQNTEVAKEIGVLLDPLETGFEAGVSSSISLNSETRIYNGCNNLGNFGNQKIQVSQKSFGKWTDLGLEQEFQNKYIFSGQYAEGKTFLIFSKPFDFPFKAGDLIYLAPSSDVYCFMNPPKSVEDELSKMGQENLLVNNCSGIKSAINVCFNAGTDCGINVRYNQGYVDKNGTRLYFNDDALMYGAIFSDSQVYECQVQRLMKRANQLVNLYEKKANLLGQEGCDSNLELSSFSSGLGSYQNSLGLSFLAIIANNIGEENDASPCRLW
jgi:hypothetical protein